MAQEATEEDADSDGEIIVQGAIIPAQGESIAQKRNADNLIDIWAADSVGRFPDQNSAAALSRLPAVAVQRDQRQGSLRVSYSDGTFGVVAGASHRCAG